MTTPAPALTWGWRLLYTVGVAVAVVTASFGSDRSGGWLGAITGGGPRRFAIPAIVVAALVLGRLVWIWCRPQALTWPANARLRSLAKIALIASLGTVAGGIFLLGANFLTASLEADVRGGLAFVVGLFLLPFMGLAPAGLIVFELARGWSARAAVPAADRVLLVVAAASGALLVLTPAISSTLFPSSNLTRAQYDGALPWVAFALGIAALIIRGFRGDRFPASAVFAMVVTAYTVGGTLMIFLWPERAGPLVAGSSLMADGAAFALVIALVPAAALTLVGGFRADRSGAWAVRALLAVPLASAVAWLGISTTTRFLKPSWSVSVMSEEQLSAQADHLRRRCAEAGSQVFRTERDVTELEIRQPAGQVGKEAPQLDFWSSPHTWFPRSDDSYELVVFVRDGQRKAWIDLPPNMYGDAHVPEKDDVHPRYVLTWRNLQTWEEQADGVIGNEMSIIDTQDNSVVARRVLFFKRTNERSGLYWEACGTLGPRFLFDSYVTEWVRAILIPKPTGQAR